MWLLVADGQVIIALLSAGLKEDFTDAVKDAWLWLWNFLTRSMVQVVAGTGPDPILSALLPGFIGKANLHVFKLFLEAVADFCLFDATVPFNTLPFISPSPLSPSPPPHHLGHPTLLFRSVTLAPLQSH